MFERLTSLAALTGLLISILLISIGSDAGSLIQVPHFSLRRHQSPKTIIEAWRTISFFIVFSLNVDIIHYKKREANVSF
jgi:uncharacterized membrane protein